MRMPASTARPCSALSRISRAATAWLIHRFIDPQATFFFGTDQEVVAREAEGAIGFHVRGTRYAKTNDGPTPFEALIAEYVPDDATLQRLAAIVRDADGPAGQERWPEAIGLRLMTVAFPEICSDDRVIVERSAFLYDALYASLTKITAAALRGK
jgi:hypothetical protein